MGLRVEVPGFALKTKQLLRSIRAGLMLGQPIQLLQQDIFDALVGGGMKLQGSCTSGLQALVSIAFG